MKNKNGNAARKPAMVKISSNSGGMNLDHYADNTLNRPANRPNTAGRGDDLSIPPELSHARPAEKSSSGWKTAGRVNIPREGTGSISTAETKQRRKHGIRSANTGTGQRAGH